MAHQLFPARAGMIPVAVISVLLEKALDVGIETLKKKDLSQARKAHKEV